MKKQILIVLNEKCRKQVFKTETFNNYLKIQKIFEISKLAFLI